MYTVIINKGVSYDCFRQTTFKIKFIHECRRMLRIFWSKSKILFPKYVIQSCKLVDFTPSKTFNFFKPFCKFLRDFVDRIKGYAAAKPDGL